MISDIKTICYYDVMRLDSNQHYAAHDHNCRHQLSQIFLEAENWRSPLFAKAIELKITVLIMNNHAVNCVALNSMHKRRNMDCKKDRGFRMHTWS